MRHAVADGIRIHRQETQGRHRQYHAAHSQVTLLAPEEKAKLKRAAALFATALWDNDVSPMQDNCGMNWGPANMASMLRGTRYTFGLFLADHPNFRNEVEAIRKKALGLLSDYTGESGAGNACAHYAGASMVPSTLISTASARTVWKPLECAASPRMA